MQQKPHMLFARIPALLLVALFAVCTLLAASFGLNTFLSIRTNSDAIYASRTGMAYLATKLRQADGEVHANGEELVLITRVGADQYQTRIYLEDGMLREGFGKVDGICEVTDLVAASSFSCGEVADGLVRFSLTDETGHTNQMCVALSAGGSR